MSRSIALTTFALASFTGMAQAREPSPFALPASGWAGIDGNWSTVEFSLGTDSQPVNVVISTALSEFWAVSTGGCYKNEPHCSEARGGLYDPSTSDNWLPMGTWELGLQYLGYGGNGQYGEDSIKSTSLIQDNADFAMNSVLMSAINTTDFFLGQFGVGITQGNFGDTVHRSPLTTAVEGFGLIPSYSYGYTAGAHYRNMPASVTLGGYDAARFEDHDDEFTLAKEEALPLTLVRGIEVKAEGSKEAPENWDSDVETLSGWDDLFTALIDTSTPFLWLPDSVCDRFADVLDLVYRDDLDLYTITNDQYRDYRLPESYTMTFSLSSTDNNNNFGAPLNAPGVVNITLPIQAFAGTVEYPFNDEAIGYRDSAVPYFSLKKSGDNSTFIIGRSFLQETYLVTEYDRSVYSIHQALFPDDPEGDADIMAIKQPSNSPYPPPLPYKDQGLGKGAIAGIVIGASVAIVLCIVGWWYCRRRKNAPAEGRSGVGDSDLEKRSAGSLGSDISKKASPLGRIFTKLALRKHSGGRPKTGEQSDQPSEVPNHEIYEMPAPAPPAELNADAGDDLVDEGAVLGLDRQTISPYEQARLKMDRQLAGPVPAYSPPADGAMLPPEKAVYDYEQPKPVPTIEVAPVSPRPLKSNNSESLQGSMGSSISPISPTANGGVRWDEPSPITAVAPQLPLSLENTSPPRSDQSQSDGSSSPSSSDPQPQSSAALRKPFDPSGVVCLGPLTENVQLAHQQSLPQIFGPDATRISPPSDLSTRDPYEDTLGSNYTEEETRLAELTAQARQHEPFEQQDMRWPLQAQGLQRGQYRSNRSLNAGRAGTPQSQERIDGMEFIHVPQPAEKRFSWEDDR